MQRHHGGLQRQQGTHCPSHRIRDVVQLQVQENGAMPRHGADNGGPGRGEKLQPHLQQTAMRRKAFGQGLGARRIA